MRKDVPMKKVNPVFNKTIDYRQYIRYLLPSVMSMVFLSFYTTVDGFFVSRFVGSDALAAINIVIPVTCIFFGVSIMLATGAGTIVGVRYGEGRFYEADSFFTFTVAALLVIIVILTAAGGIFLDPILRICGSTDILMPYTRPYGMCLVIMTPAMILKLFFEYFARTDGHPAVAMMMSVTGLVINILLDFVLVVLFDAGILGAGIATCIAMYISAAIGIFHFISGRSNLKFVRPKIEAGKFLKACYNGISEMMTELSTGVTTLFFNLTLLKLSGEDGVAAMSIITYFYYFFASVYFGITVAAQPVISYNTGSGDRKKLKEIVHQSLVSIAIVSAALTVFSFSFAGLLVMIFSKDPSVIAIAVPGFRIFCTSFLLCGLNIFISGYFTAIGSGGLSALVSFCRSLIFVILFLEFLPSIAGINGVWATPPMAEAATALIAVPLYRYFKRHDDRHIDKIYQ